MSRFDGHRIYNGCPDSTLQAKWDRTAKLVKKMEKEIPTTFCTWFPQEQYWTVTARDPYTRPEGYEGAAYTELACHRDKETAINTALEEHKMWTKITDKLQVRNIGICTLTVECGRGVWNWSVDDGTNRYEGCQRTGHRAKIAAIAKTKELENS